MFPILAELSSKVGSYISTYRRFLPFRDRAPDDSKQRVHLQVFGLQACEPRWITDSEFSPEVLPFVFDLARRNEDLSRLSSRRNPGAIEVISTISGFLLHRAQVAGNRSDRPRRLAEPDQLWVMAITNSLSLKYRLREQGFTPKRNKSARIEILRMKTPETHRLFRERERSENCEVGGIQREHRGNSIRL